MPTRTSRPLSMAKNCCARRNFAQLGVIEIEPPFSDRRFLSLLLTIAIAAAIVIVVVITPPLSHTAQM